MGRGDGGLTRVQREAVDRTIGSGERLAVSAIIFFWEIAKLVERGRIRLPRSIDQLFDELECHPQLAVLPLSPRISLESTRLGERFHKDTAVRRHGRAAQS